MFFQVHRDLSNRTRAASIPGTDPSGETPGIYRGIPTGMIPKRFQHSWPNAVLFSGEGKTKHRSKKQINFLGREKRDYSGIKQK